MKGTVWGLFHSERGGHGYWIGSVAVVISASAVAVVLLRQRAARARSLDHTLDRFYGVRDGLLDTIGGTPLLYLSSLSKATGCKILAKVEFMNPGGSVKDRVAAHIVKTGLETGALSAGGLVAEGTSGSTGISLSMVAQAVGCRSYVALPDDAAGEKARLLEAVGAEVQRCRPVSIAHQEHFVHRARRAAEHACSTCGAGAGLFANQFENPLNTHAHLRGTAPEIWRQTAGRIDAFVAAAGTGGTIAGVSHFLKGMEPGIKTYLIDPQGSSLHNKVGRGVAYTRHEAEGRRLKHPDDTVMEGIGLNRLTANFNCALIDATFQGTDQEAVHMARYLLSEEGLFLGSSSAMNCVGAFKVAKELGPGHTVVTILCDSGARHVSKFWCDEVLEKRGLHAVDACDAMQIADHIACHPSTPAFRR